MKLINAERFPDSPLHPLLAREMLNVYQERRRIFGSLGGTMRSDLVFGATKHVSNRYLFVRALAKATRGFHKPGTRIQETTNDVLKRLGQANPIARGGAVPIAASIPTRHRRPLVAITHQSKRLNVPAILEGPHSLSEALRRPSNWAKA
jgi:hypothetical protein